MVNLQGKEDLLFSFGKDGSIKTPPVFPELNFKKKILVEIVEFLDD